MKKKIVGIILSLSLCLQSGIIYAKDTTSLPITAYEQENGITDIEMFEYQQGATFGAKNTPTVLSNLDILQKEYGIKYGYGSNSAQHQDVFYYQDQDGRLHIVHSEKQKIIDMLLDEKNNIVDTNVVTTALPIVGGFYYNKEVGYYVVSGQENIEENSNKTVVVVEKFSLNWGLLGKLEIKGDIEHLFQGITKPFDAGSCRIEQYGKYLIVHTARKMFQIDGINHQSNLAFLIDTDTMTTIENPKIPYVSHSFNQFITLDEEGSAYYLNHGDAGKTRGLVVSKYVNWTIPSELGRFANQDGIQVNIFPFIDREKEHYNYTGCIVTGFEKIGEQLVTVGASIPQDKTQSEDGKDFRNKNVFVNFTDKYLNQSKTIWLTDYNPTILQYEVTEPKLIKIDEERFIILYGVKQKDDYILCYRELDNNGNLIEAVDYKDVVLCGNSQPYFDGKRIFWLGYNRDECVNLQLEAGGLDRWYSNNPKSKQTKVFLYSIPYGKIPIEQMDKEKDEITIKEGESYTLAPVLTPNLPEHLADIVWRSGDEQTAIVKNGVLTGGFYGKTTLVGTLGNKKIQYDVEVQYDANNKPLGQIQLKTKSLKGNKFQFEWKPVKGAYGYEIYKRQKNGTYKKIKTLNARITKCTVQRQKTDKKYSYKIRAYGMKADGQMKYSKWVEKTNDKKKSVKKIKKTVTRKKK